ncbi:hypothetical protein [Endozoicomonas sp. SCSIO W0465]|uniref:hypothetical protein n=1 Tax=unclassified Endozoicomonas TaxID=2644528 RepID=UPI0020752DCE|nr:hypothetical protein [Endozoicomonas sp. SCSIO W0465]USE38938.1 hypothetical protein MJO57_12665 [Endozoicomonas sp. SCSIO W0465]
MSPEQQMIDLYIQAEKDLLAGKNVSMNGRTITMENLNEIREGRQEWERRLQAKTRRKPYSVGVINW